MRIKPLMTIALSALILQGSSCGGNSAASAAPGIPNAAGPLLTSLTREVPGLSEAQAALGAGSLLGLAKARMPPTQFSEVSRAIPGTEALVRDAVRQGLPQSPPRLSGITGFLAKSGISPSQVNQMVPVLTNSVAGKLPAEVVDALSAALK